MQTKLWLKAALALTVIYLALFLFMFGMQAKSLSDVGLLLLNFLSATLLIPIIALWVSLFVSEKISRRLYTKGWYVVIVALITLGVYLITTFAIGSASSWLFYAGAPRIFRVEEIFSFFTNALAIVAILITSTLLWVRMRKNIYTELNQPVPVTVQPYSKNNILISMLGGAISGYWVGAKLFYLINDRYIPGPDADFSPLLFMLGGTVVGFIVFLIATYLLLKEQKRTSTSVLTLIALAIVVLFAGSFFVYPPVAPISSNTYYTQKALSEKNQDLCYSTKNKKIEERCLLKVAQVVNDITLCKPLTDTRYIKDCLTTVGASVADRKLVCDMYVPEDKDCKMYVDYTDTTLYQYNGCDYRDVCYADSAVTFKDRNYCSSIAEPRQRNECYFKFAVENGDVSTCNELEKSADKNYCLARINKTTSYCARITDKEILKYNTSNSSDIVSGVYFTKPSDACIFDVAVINGDKAMCNQISKQYNQQNIDKCYAIVDNNVNEYCSKNATWDNCESFITDVIRRVENMKY